MSKIGIIAGGGELPIYVAQRVKDKGIELIVICLDNNLEEFKNYTKKIYPFDIGNVSGIIDVLHKEGIRELAIIGKVSKEIIFHKERFDKWSTSIIERLANCDDQTIMEGIIAELAREGIHIIPQTAYIGDMLVKEGVLTQRYPSDELWAEIRYGVQKAEDLAQLNIGQTVVVKNRLILAVETIEGTDATISRGGSFAKGAIVVKTSRINYDPRFDIATVGLSTLETMKNVAAQCLALKVNAVFIIDEQRMIEYANANSMIIVGVDGASS